MVWRASSKSPKDRVFIVIVVGGKGKVGTLSHCGWPLPARQPLSIRIKPLIPRKLEPPILRSPNRN
jgi:hypothetical protein